MTWLPVLDRELRAAARRTGTYWARALAGAAAVGLALSLLLAGFSRALTPAAAGQTFLLCLSGLGYAFAIVTGVLSTCDCLSRERREGTLDLLFLTNLHGYEIVLGKFAPRFFHLCYCVLAALPSLSLVFLLGGVTLGEAAGVALGVLNALFLFAALGMMVSAPSSRERRVFFAAVWLALLFGVAAPAGGRLIGELAWGVKAPWSWVALGPAGFGAALSGAPTTSGFPGPRTILGCFLFNHLLGWCFLVVAAGLLGRRAFQSTEAPTRARRWLEPRYCQGGAAARPQARDEADSWWFVNPVFRKTLRTWTQGSYPGRRFGLAIACLVTALLALPGAWLVPEGWSAGSGFPSVWLSPPIFPATVVLLHLLLKFAVTVEACQALGGERRNGNLELLLVTPAGDEAIVRGQLLALKRRYLAPTLLVLGYQSFARSNRSPPGSTPENNSLSSVCG